MLKLSNADIDLIISLRTAGVCSWAEIGKRVSLESRQVEYVYLREAQLRSLPKLPRLPRAGAKPKPQPRIKVEPKIKVKVKPEYISQADKDLIVELRCAGGYWDDIAKRLSLKITQCKYIYYGEAEKLKLPKLPRLKIRKGSPTNKRKGKRKKRRTVSGGCLVCNGMVSFLIRGKSMDQIGRMSGVCDTCNTLFHIREVLWLDSIHPVQRITDDYDSYVGLRISKMGKFVK